ASTCVTIRSVFYLFLLIPPPPTSTLFPYTTLFRSPPANIIRQVGGLSFISYRSSRKSSSCTLAFAVHPVQQFPVRLEDRKKYCRSEEHTSELQSRENLVCRLLLEKKKNMCITI